MSFSVFSGGEATHVVKRFTGLYTGPYFDPSTTTNITTQLGTHAYLPCKVKQLGNKSVSWIRRRDAHILTVDRYTFIADERFQAFLVEATDTWTLQVKYVQARDAGQYECQVSTEPKMSHFITLNVVGMYLTVHDFPIPDSLPTFSTNLIQCEIDIKFVLRPHTFCTMFLLLVFLFLVFSPPFFFFASCFNFLFSFSKTNCLNGKDQRKRSLKCF